jgi:hypothetical protein
MRAFDMGFVGEHPRVSGLGARVAAWLKAQRLTAQGVVLKTGLDKRDAQRVLDGSCGPRAFDRLAAAYGWDFVEAVMTPAIGADPITAREAELATRQAEAAAIHARLQRERAARGAQLDGHLRVVRGASDLSGAPLGGGA